VSDPGELHPGYGNSTPTPSPAPTSSTPAAPVDRSSDTHDHFKEARARIDSDPTNRAAYETDDAPADKMGAGRRGARACRSRRKGCQVS
jgi:hypothetical protein